MNAGGRSFRHVVERLSALSPGALEHPRSHSTHEPGLTSASPNHCVQLSSPRGTRAASFFGAYFRSSASVQRSRLAPHAAVPHEQSLPRLGPTQQSVVLCAWVSASQLRCSCMYVRLWRWWEKRRVIRTIAQRTVGRSFAAAPPCLTLHTQHTESPVPPKPVHFVPTSPHLAFRVRFPRERACM